MLCHMKLTQTSVEWALDFISAKSDSDLFPPTPELQAIQPLRQQLLDALTTPELQSLTLGPYRRFLVPKDEVSDRQATQLDPQDALILTALMHEYGDGIEKRRASRSQVSAIDSNRIRMVGSTKRSQAGMTSGSRWTIVRFKLAWWSIVISRTSTIRFITILSRIS
jgi:hypothetical protein